MVVSCLFGDLRGGALRVVEMRVWVGFVGDFWGRFFCVEGFWGGGGEEYGD